MRTATTDAAISTAIRIMLATYLVAAIYSILAGLGVLSCMPAPRGWVFDWRGFPPVERADRAVEIVVERAPCTPRGAWKGGRISFYEDPFYCGGPGGPILVHGCMPAGPTLPTFAVGYRVPLSDSALPDELGHYFFMSCGLGLGEDAAGVYTADFIAWLDAVRTAMRAEGL